MNRKRPTNQLGFALPLVLMMMGVTILLMVAVFNLNIIATKVVERSYLQSQFRTFVTQVNSMLKDENSCRTAIGGPTGPNSQPGSGAPLATGVAQPFNSSGITPIYLFYPQSQTYPFVTASGGPLPNPPPNPIPSTYGDLRITQFSLTSPALVTAATALSNMKTYQTTLSITAEPVRYSDPAWRSGAQSFTGGKSFSSNDIQLTVVIDSDSNLIASCNSLTFGTPTNHVPIPVCSPLWFLSAASGQVQCRQLGCPEPGIRYGWNDDGTPNCSPTGTPSAPPTGQPTPQSTLPPI